MPATVRPRVAIALTTLCFLPASACGPDARPSDQAGSEGEARSATTGPVPADRCDDLASTLESSGTAAGDVCRVTFPRTDLEVSLRGATLPRSMGLTSWAASG